MLDSKYFTKQITIIYLVQNSQDKQEISNEVTEPVSEPITESDTEQDTELDTGPVTELETELDTDPVIEPVTKPVIEQVAESYIDRTAEFAEATSDNTKPMNGLHPINNLYMHHFTGTVRIQL